MKSRWWYSASLARNGLAMAPKVGLQCDLRRQSIRSVPLVGVERAVSSKVSGAVEKDGCGCTTPLESLLRVEGSLLIAGITTSEQYFRSGEYFSQGCARCDWDCPIPSRGWFQVGIW